MEEHLDAMDKMIDYLDGKIDSYSLDDKEANGSLVAKFWDQFNESKDAGSGVMLTESINKEWPW